MNCYETHGELRVPRENNLYDPVGLSVVLITYRLQFGGL
jgi:hypothetical protein